MSYVGNTPTQQAFTPAVDYFSGNGANTAFTLSRPVASVAQVEVIVNNVAQNPSTAYTINGNTITFTGAPSAGTNNIYVRYTSPITQVIQPGQGTVGTSALADAAVTTAKIADANITASKLAAGQVLSLNGVAFPSTQVASSDANTLDDYEEGTWTPSWGAASGSMTYNLQLGRYVKVGRLVTVTCHIQTTANNTLTGNVFLSGLPFASDSSAGNYVVGCVHAEKVSLAASAWIWCHVGPNSTTADMRYWANAASAGYIQGSYLQATSDMMVAITYLTTQ